MDNSAIMCDKIEDSFDEEREAKAKSYDETNFNEKKATCKMQNFYILVEFLLLTIALMIAVSIYCYLMKYRAKQKHLSLCHDTNNQLKQVLCR